MLKNISRLECIVNGKVFHLLCEMDSATVEVKAALEEFNKFIERLEGKVKEAEDQKKASEECAQCEICE